MSSEDYGTESFETTKSSDYAAQRSISDEFMESVNLTCSEIEEEHYDEFKPQVEILVQRSKQKFRTLELTDCYDSDRPGMFLEILPKIIFETTDTDGSIEDVEFPKPIFRQTFDQSTIASVEYESSSAQTLRKKLVNSWCQYEPRILNQDESIAISEKEGFHSFLKQAEKRVFKSLIQNKTADSFFQELKPLTKIDADFESSSDISLTIQAFFYCFEGEDKQIIKSICWHPVQKDIFIASTLRDITFEERIECLLEAPCDSFTSYVWSCKNQFVPKMYLEYFNDVVLHKVNPTFPNIVAGGTLNGLLVLWNLDQADILETSISYEDETSKPAVLSQSVSSALDHSHSRAVTDLVWIPSHFEVSTRGNVKPNITGECYQIASYGLDGVLKFWDLRTSGKPGKSLAKLLKLLDRKWEPFHSVEIVSNERNLAITRFALKETYDYSKSEILEEVNKKKISTEFYAGCDDGKIFCGSFKISRDDTGKFSPVPPQFFKSPHNGTVTALCVSPFISNAFLSTGSRTVAIWNQEIKDSPMYTKDMHTNISAAIWSITRPALFILGYEDGSVEIWDLINSIYEPYLIHYVSTAFITALSLQEISKEEYLLCVGDSEGLAFTIVLSSYLWKPLENELQFMKEFVEKTSKCLKTTLHEIQNFKDTKSSEKEDIETSTTTDEKFTDEILQSNYQEFLEMQKIQLKYLGIIK